jgi:hypothetical protein
MGLRRRWARPAAPPEPVINTILVLVLGETLVLLQGIWPAAAIGSRLV